MFFFNFILPELQIRIVPTPPQLEVPEEMGPATVCVEVSNNGQLSPGLTAVVTLSTQDVTAVGEFSYNTERYENFLSIFSYLCAATEAN